MLPDFFSLPLEESLELPGDIASVASEQAFKWFIKSFELIILMMPYIETQPIAPTNRASETIRSADADSQRERERERESLLVAVFIDCARQLVTVVNSKLLCTDSYKLDKPRRR